MLAEIKHFHFIVWKHPHRRLLARFASSDSWCPASIQLEESSVATCSRFSPFVQPSLAARCIFNMTAIVSDNSYFSPRMNHSACRHARLPVRACSLPTALFLLCAEKVLGSARLLRLPPTCLYSLSQFILVVFAPCLGVVVVARHNDSFTIMCACFVACHRLTCAHKYSHEQKSLLKKLNSLIFIL